MIDAIIGLAVAAISIVAALFWGKRKGAQAERETTAKRQAAADARTHTQAKEARDEVDGLSDDAVLDRLRKRAAKPAGPVRRD